MTIIISEPYSNTDGDEKLDQNALATAAIGVTAGLANAITQRQRRPLTEIEQKCGKKPLLFKGNWERCVQQHTNSLTNKISNAFSIKDGNITKPLLIGGGVLVGALLIVMILKK